MKKTLKYFNKEKYINFLINEKPFYYYIVKKYKNKYRMFMVYKFEEIGSNPTASTIKKISLKSQLIFLKEFIPL